LLLWAKPVSSHERESNAALAAARRPNAATSSSSVSTAATNVRDAIMRNDIRATVLQPAALAATEAVEQADKYMKTGSTGKPEKQLINCSLITKANAGKLDVRPALKPVARGGTSPGFPPLRRLRLARRFSGSTVARTIERRGIGCLVRVRFAQAMIRSLTKKAERRGSVLMVLSNAGAASNERAERFADCR
jgi:hypothetical protein